MDSSLDAFLRAIRREIIRAPAWEELLGGVVDRMLERWGAAAGLVYASRSEAAELELRSLRVGPRGSEDLGLPEPGEGSLRVGKGDGLPGEAWAAGKPIWVRDGSRDLAYLTGHGVTSPEAHADVATAPEHPPGLGAALAVPVTGGSEDAVLLLVFPEPGERDPELAEAASLVGRVLAEVSELLLGQDGGRPERDTGETGLVDPEGPPAHLGILNDLAARWPAEREARLLDTVVQRSTDAVAIMNGTFREGGPFLVYVNPAFTRLTGYSETEAVGRSLRSLMGPETDPGARERLRRRLLAGETAREELVLHRKDGTHGLVGWEVHPVGEGEPEDRHFVAIGRERTREPALPAAGSRAERDPLTGLPERSRFMRRVARALDQARAPSEPGFAVLAVELDGGAGNGVQGGESPPASEREELLVAAASRLEAALRPGDQVARSDRGGFLVFLEGAAAAEETREPARRIQERLSTPWRLDGREVRVHPRVGAAWAGGRHADAETLLQEAYRSLESSAQPEAG